MRNLQYRTSLFMVASAATPRKTAIREEASRYTEARLYRAAWIEKPFQPLSPLFPICLHPSSERFASTRYMKPEARRT